MTIESEIKRYIKNYFHPYYDITLCPESLPLTEPINCIIPTDFRTKLSYVNFTHNQPENTEDANTILNRYEDTNIEKEYEVLCTKVTDGDTIEVKVLRKLSKHIIVYDNVETMKIRLVGINTPEKNKTGYNVSKNFVKKLCENEIIYLNIDNKSPMDSYGRMLAVVIVKNKNLNQILLKEGLAEIMLIPPSEFNPFQWDKTAYVSELTLNQQEELNFSQMLPYLNNEFNNIVFTDQDNYNIIHKFEMYKGVIYLRLYPYNSQIRLHILPKSYKGDSNLLIFKDILVTNENITKSNCSSLVLPPINVFSAEDNTCYEMNYDISKSTKGFTTLQINAGYRYPESVEEIFHLTGVKDETNKIIADRCTLLDANYDGYKNPVNNITQFLFISNKVTPPSINNFNIKAKSNNMNNNHLGESKIFHKTIKYMNDDLYIEEERKHLKHNWGE